MARVPMPSRSPFIKKPSWAWLSAQSPPKARTNARILLLSFISELRFLWFKRHYLFFRERDEELLLFELDDVDRDFFDDDRTEELLFELRERDRFDELTFGDEERLLLDLSEGFACDRLFLETFLALLLDFFSDRDTADLADDLERLLVLLTDERDFLELSSAFLTRCLETAFLVPAVLLVSALLTEFPFLIRRDAFLPFDDELELLLSLETVVRPLREDDLETVKELVLYLPRLFFWRRSN